MKAELVFDGTIVRLPSSQGIPCEDQNQGTEFEKLGELASRVCYASYGVDEKGKRKGRGSKELHQHILEVENHSVYEHCVYTIAIPITEKDEGRILKSCINRKGVWVEMRNGTVEITANLRAVLEWDRHTKQICLGEFNERVKGTLQSWGHTLAPWIVNPYEEQEEINTFEQSWLKKNLSDDQAWISLRMEGSRGWSHEMVRHRFAMSQRSTRYVDESRSEYKTHPLVDQYLEDPNEEWKLLNETIARSISADRATYLLAVVLLEKYLEGRGMGKTAARKQARGAARGYLGNALGTEMIYSAPISGWKWILRNRLSELADGEIRGIMEDVLGALQGSAYGDRFSEFTLIDSPDGIGRVLG